MIENQIALQKIARKTRKITEFFNIKGNQKLKTPQFETNQYNNKDQLDFNDYKHMIKKLKNNYKMKEL